MAGSELGDSLAAVSLLTTDAIGSTNSRSGLGMPKGAKSDPRKADDATRTVAAASEYEGRTSLFGLAKVEDDFAGRSSSSNALNFEGNAEAE